MLRLTARLVTAVLALGLVVAGFPVPAQAAYLVCTGGGVSESTCTESAPGAATPGDPSMDPSTGLTPSPPVCLDRNPAGNYDVLDCTLDGAWWSNARQCYMSPSVTERERPEGSTSGGYYICYPSPADLIEIGCTRVPCAAWYTVPWLENPPPGVTTLNPGQAAEIMMDSFDLFGIDIGFAPDPDIADSRSYVGVPIWMWVDAPTESTFGPLERVTPLGGVTITSSAEVTSILWDMGDGTTVACAGLGTPFVVAYGAVDSPTCGHRYSRTSNGQPGGEYTVTATSQWSVTWSGGGQSGVIPVTTESSTTVDINQLQSVNVGRAR